MASEPLEVVERLRHRHLAQRRPERRHRPAGLPVAAESLVRFKIGKDVAG
jgi:hypothetical protein